MRWPTTGQTLPTAVSIARAQQAQVRRINSGLVVLNIGPILVWCAVIGSLLTQVTASTINIGPIPAVLALIALALGIPHGSADNLTLVHELNWRGWIRIGVIYVSIAAAAALVIIAFPAFGFVLVLAMSVWHFGTGDV